MSGQLTAQEEQIQEQVDRIAAMEEELKKVCRFQKAVTSSSLGRLIHSIKLDVKLQLVIIRSNSSYRQFLSASTLLVRPILSAWQIVLA